MSNDLKIFSQSDFGEIRTAVTESNEPMFCLADICRALDLTQVSRVKDRLDEDEVTQINLTDSLGRNQLTNFVTESGLYDVIIRSDSPKAKPFRNWVTHTVLPTLRKDGVYMIGEEKAKSEDEIILLAHQLLQNKVDRLLAENKILSTQIEQDQHKVFGYMNMISTDGYYSVEQAAKWMTEKGFKIGRNQLFKQLRDIGLLRKNNLPYQKYIKQELFTVKAVTINNFVKSQTFISNKGLDCVWNKITDKMTD